MPKIAPTGHGSGARRQAPGPSRSEPAAHTAGWLGRFLVVLENLLEHVDQAPFDVPKSPQHRAHALLGKLLDRCDREDLPVLHWAIAPHGLLTARCLDDDQPQRIVAFQAWTRALDLGLWPEDTSPAGAIRHQAVRENLDGADISLIADIHPENRS